MKIDRWVGAYKVYACSWSDKRIYFNVQYYTPGQSIAQPPVWEKTVYIINDDAGQQLVFDFTDSLTEYVANLRIPDKTEVIITVDSLPLLLRKSSL